MAMECRLIWSIKQFAYDSLGMLYNSLRMGLIFHSIAGIAFKVPLVAAVLVKPFESLKLFVVVLIAFAVQEFADPELEFLDVDFSIPVRSGLKFLKVYPQRVSQM